MLKVASFGNFLNEGIEKESRVVYWFVTCVKRCAALLLPETNEYRRGKGARISMNSELSCLCNDSAELSSIHWSELWGETSFGWLCYQVNTSLLFDRALEARLKHLWTAHDPLISPKTLISILNSENTCLSWQWLMHWTWCCIVSCSCALHRSTTSKVFFYYISQY